MKEYIEAREKRPHRRCDILTQIQRCRSSGPDHDPAPDAMKMRKVTERRRALRSGPGSGKSAGPRQEPMSCSRIPATPNCVSSRRRARRCHRRRLSQHRQPIRPGRPADRHGGLARLRRGRRGWDQPIDGRLQQSRDLDNAAPSAVPLLPPGRCVNALLTIHRANFAGWNPSEVECRQPRRTGGSRGRQCGTPLTEWRPRGRRADARGARTAFARGNGDDGGHDGGSDRKSVV